MVEIIDQRERQQAIDLTDSFIVQAPAGSGKTELLTLRFLKALAFGVMEPEEVLAITFTKKAASEMQERMMTALLQAKNTPMPETEPEKTRWILAEKVLKKDQENKWEILTNPLRLRVLTLDALSASLCRQMPFLSGLGLDWRISQEPYLLYQLASARALADLNQQGPYTQHLCALSLYLSNRSQIFINLLSDMLSKRDQWIGQVMFYRDSSRDILRDQLENALKEVISDHLNVLSKEWQSCELSIENFSQLLTYYRFAMAMLNQDASDASFDRLHFSVEHLPFIRKIIAFLTTQSSGTLSFRKPRGINKTRGFPSEKEVANPEEKALFKKMKTEFCGVLESLGESGEALLAAFNWIVKCPSPFYSEDQWQMIHHLMEILPISYAHLKAIFKEKKSIDFIELNLHALTSLGDEFAPSDLELKLDYQIKHILIDEFQDTSLTQYHLLYLLTRGWYPGEGKTLFLVGDPMQSIYRFRQAEVGLFLKAKEEGIGSMPLTFIQLKANFRSIDTVVDWVNHHFSRWMPEKDDFFLSAISYAKAQAVKKTTDEQKSEWHQAGTPKELGVFLTEFSDTDAEMTEIVHTIQSLRATCKESSIAILIRTRSHIQSLLPKLIEARVPLVAVEMQSALLNPAIEDIYSLLVALLQPWDRIAWFSILRAPWCGLSLSMLTELSQDLTVPIWQIIEQSCDAKVLWCEEFLPLQHFVKVLRVALPEVMRLPLKNVLQWTWQALGGDRIWQKEQPAMDAFWRMFDEVLLAEQLFDLTTFRLKLARLYLDVTFGDITKGDIPVQMMTIHKSKGLQFDHVLIPCCHKESKLDSSDFLAWLRMPVKAGRRETFIMAPIARSEGERDGIFSYIRAIEKEKEANELLRLFYVAVTRAKNSVLISLVQSPKKSYKKNTFASFLSAAGLLAAPEGVDEESDEETPIDTRQHLAPSLYRIAARAVPELNSRLSWQHLQKSQQNEDLVQEPPLVPLSQKIDRAVGTFLHELFCVLAQKDFEKQASIFLELLKQKGSFPLFWLQRMKALGLTHALAPRLLETVLLALENTLHSAWGRWMLSPHHVVSLNEWAVWHRLPKKTEVLQAVQFPAKKQVMDRVILSDQILWVIDYKFVTNTNQPLQEFLNEEWKKYEKTLYGYGKTLRRFCAFPIRLALYFPLMDEKIVQDWAEFFYTIPEI